MNKFLFMTKVCFKHMPDYSLFHNILKLCKVLGKARFTTNKMVFDISYEIFFFHKLPHELSNDLRIMI